jgi:hypothetical protein
MVPGRISLSEIWLTITGPHPLFFVSVASKGFSAYVSSLKSTLMGSFASVDSKGLRESRKWKSENEKWPRRDGANG